MSSFKDYLSGNTINESNHSLLKSEFAKLAKEVDSKFKHITLGMQGSVPYIGMNSNTIKLYVDIDGFDDVNITQTSKKDHTAGTLKIMAEVAMEISNNMAYIEKTLKTAKSLFDTYA